MRTILKNCIYFITLIIVLVLTSCQKDNLGDAIITESTQSNPEATTTEAQDGKDGDQGIAGEDGKDGTDGATGPAGPKGETGDTGPQGETGPTGPKGDTGDTGPQGETGPAGPQGEPGTNGSDGVNGEDGEDGNANVQSFTYDLSSVATSYYGFDIPEVTADVLREDAILTYLQFSEPRLLTFQLPSKILVGFGAGRSLNSDVGVSYFVGRGSLFFREIGATSSLRDEDIRAGDLKKLRIIIIESSSSETRKSAKQNIRQELKMAGIDIDNYEEVAQYYGLN